MNPRLRRTLGRLLTLLLSEHLPAQAANPATATRPEARFLEVSFQILGKGSDPETDPDVANAEQSWTFSRNYHGVIEVRVENRTVGSPPNEQTVLVIVPAISGVSRVFGARSDWVQNAYRTFGEGDSYFDNTATMTWKARSPVVGRRANLNLILNPETRVWNGTIGPGLWEDDLVRETVIEGQATITPGGGGSRNPAEIYPIQGKGNQVSGNLQVNTRYVPSEPWQDSLAVAGEPAFVLEGHYNGYVEKPLISPTTSGARAQMIAKFGWALLDRLPDVELVVRSPQYEHWRPELDINLKPGASLEFDARLESPSDDDLSRVEVEQFVWTLTDTSREPGVALNYPLAAKDTNPDLRLVGIPTEDADGQRAVEKNPDRKVTRVKAESHDWGGWSTLRVEAHLKDGRILHGRLEGAGDASGDQDIRIPNRDENSRIARVWLEKMGVAGQLDTDDLDAEPKGRPGADGDGLSLYEEYRGFYAEGRHLQTNPKRKDLFIRNNADAEPLSESAISRFQSISGLDVHLCNELEYDPFRNFTINQNRSAGPTKGSQAGLWLFPSDSPTRPNDYLPSGTRPRDHRRIRVPGAPEGLGSTVNLNAALEHVVVQALFQSVAVDRPGPSDRVRLFELLIPSTGSSDPAQFRIIPTFTPVVVLDAAGRDLAALWSSRVSSHRDRASKRGPVGLSPADRARFANLERGSLTTFHWLVGEKRGAHSGPVDCVMRDWFADVYQSATTSADGLPIYRFVDRSRGGEKPGPRLGTTREGTGINAPTATPESRYGDGSGVAANRQMVISDSLP